MKQLFKKISSAITLLSLLVMSAGISLAQITNPAIGNLGSDPEAAKDGSLFLSYFVNIWRVIINLGAITLIIYFLWGALEWISAGGDSGKVEKARQRMTNAVLGIIILVSSFTIIAFMSKLLFGDNFNLLQLTFPSADSVI